MTVPVQETRVTYDGDGVVDTFAYPFRILDQAHIAVYVDDVLKTITTHYTVTGVDAEDGGDVVFNDPPANGAVIAMLRNMPLSRTLYDYQNAGEFRSATVNKDFDSLTMQIQQIAEGVSRAMAFGISVESPPTALDAPIAGYYPRLKSDLSGIEWVAGSAYQTEPTPYTVTPADFVEVGDVDSTESLRRCYDFVQGQGGGCIDFGDVTYTIFTDADGHSTDPDTIFPFDSCNGITLKFSGATFICTSNFPTPNVRGVIFEFTDCIGVTFEGHFRIRYSGDRGATDPGDGYLGMYQRGLVGAKFWTGNVGITGCTIDAEDCSAAVWFNNLGAQANGTRLIKNFAIKAKRVGYPWLTDKSGHQATGIFLYTDDCGRSCLLQDVDGPSDIMIVSANHRASTDFGFSGNISALRFAYINTQSSGADLGRCVQLSYPVDTGRVLKDVAGTVYVSTSGGAYTQYAFKAGYATGVTEVAADYIVDGLDVSVNVVSDTSNQQCINFEHPTQWSTGANIRNLRVHNSRFQGGGLCAFDLRGVAGNATLENIQSESNLQLQGNSTGIVTGRNIIATTVCNSGDTSRVFLDTCNNTSATFGSTGKFLTNTYINGVLYNTPHIRSQELQTFTVRVLNDAGTLQHQIFNVMTASAAAAYAGKIAGTDINPNTLPDVSGGATPFTAGAGRNDNDIVFDTAAQTNANAFLLAVVEKYDGNVTTPAAAAIFTSVNVNGTTRNRLTMRFTDALSGADWTINTTNIPAGKAVWVKFIGYIV